VSSAAQNVNYGKNLAHLFGPKCERPKLLRNNEQLNPAAIEALLHGQVMANAK
jgi:hypothetical protein